MARGALRRAGAGERGGTGAEIGIDEISVPVVEGEVVVDKRPVVKEELRVLRT